METDVLYHIHWRALKTGKTGYGSGTFPKWQAELICESLNLQAVGLLIHWIEPEKQEAIASQEL